MEKTLKCLKLLEEEVRNGDYSLPDNNLEVLDLIIQARSEITVTHFYHREIWCVFHNYTKTMARINRKAALVTMFSTVLLIAAVLAQAYVSESSFSTICYLLSVALWGIVFVSNFRLYRKYKKDAEEVINEKPGAH